MKKIYLLLLFVFGFSAFAQQKGISYQAVIINPNGINAPGYNGTSIPLANKAICLSFKIINSTNQVEYQESQSITTDTYGMVNVVIGTGTSRAGLVANLDDVNWNKSTKKLVVAVNIYGVCSDYTEISNQALSFTPYSYYAQNADIKDGYVTDVKVAMGINPAKVGLGNVDNTCDANKPVSTATQSALDLKADISSLSTVAISGDYNDLSNKPTISLPTTIDASSLSGTLAVAKGGTGSTTKNFVDLSNDQTISGAKTFTTNGTYSAALTVSGNLVAPNIGSSSVVDFTHKIVSAATTNTFTKLIQFGTGGLAGSNTIINIGSGLSGANNTLTIGGPASASTTRTTINGTLVIPALSTDGIVTSNANGVLTTNPTLPVATGGTGASSLSGYVKGNGTNALTASSTIPSSDITGLIKKVNGSLPDADGLVTVAFGTVTTGTLASRPVNVGTNGNIYVVSVDPNSSDNGRTYISDGTNWNEVTSNQAATDARYMPLAGGTLAGSLTIPTNKILTITDIPTNNTDAANKTYVDATIANAAVSTNSAFQMVKRDALGNFAAGNITADLTGNVLGDVTGNVSGTANNVTGIVTVENGGTGAANLTGYLKGNGTTAFSSSTTIPASDITGLIKKINGSLPDVDGNVAISFGTVFTGTLANRPTIAGTNGNIYVVSGDSTSTENGRTFISDGTRWNEVTSNQSATDARYLQLAGGTLSGNLVVPSSNKITLTDAPVLNTDAANKAYVDSITSSATIADASTSTLGKIQLGGDLAGSGTSATSPRISSVGGSTASLLNTAEIATNAATASNTANQIVKRDGTGNFTATTITANLTGNVIGTATNVSGVVSGANGGTGVANSGKTLTLGGNFSTGHALTFTTSATSTLSLPTSGTLATVQQLDAKELISNKSTATDLGNTSTSDDKYPSQKAVKTYVDGKVSAGASSIVGYTTALQTNGNNPGTNNVGIGPSTVSGIDGGGNTSIGSIAMQNNTAGWYNTTVGFRAMSNISSSGSNDNVAIGNAAAYYRGSGWDVNNQQLRESIYIGSMSRASANNQRNEIVIGYNAIGSGTNTIQLGNTSISDVYTSGNIRTSNNVFANGVQLTSDYRLKKNIVPLVNGISTIMKLNPVNYEKKISIESSNYVKKESGFIAQEIQKILPNVVMEGVDKDKLLSVDYISIIPVLTKGIQEQQLLIIAQQKQIDELKMIVEKIKKENK